MAAVRQLVAERFSSNPAYQLLKARFLSCFTVPALLASLPTERKVEPRQANQEEEQEDEEGEEEVQIKKLKEMSKSRRAEVGCVDFQIVSGSGSIAVGRLPTALCDHMHVIWEFFSPAFLDSTGSKAQMHSVSVSLYSISFFISLQANKRLLRSGFFL